MSERTCDTCGGTASSEHPCRCCGTLGYHGGKNKHDDCIAEKMKEHTWQITEVDGPGAKYFWVCRACGSGGGPSFLPWEQLDIKAPRWMPFLVGTPLINLSEDCDEAKKQIDDYIEKYPTWKEYAEKGRRAG